MRAVIFHSSALPQPNEPVPAPLREPRNIQSAKRTRARTRPREPQPRRKTNPFTMFVDTHLCVSQDTPLVI